MKIDKRKLQIAMANACMNTEDVAEKSGLPRPTVNRVITRQGSRPGTIGKIAKALGVDVTEIIED